MRPEVNTNRRQFVKTAAAGIAAAGVNVGKVSATPFAWTDGRQITPGIPNTRVVCCYDTRMVTKPTATSSFPAENAAVDTARVEANMDAMAKSLTGNADAAAAWDTIFQKPASKAWDAVGAAIKTCSLVETTSARTAVVGKVCKELIRKGVKPASINVYDAGVGATGSIYAAFVGTGLPAGVKVQNRLGERGNVSGGSCLKFIYDGSTDILVNIASNKGHDYGDFGQLTMTMKNHYGTFSPNHDANFMFSMTKSDAIMGGTPARQQLCIVDSLWAVKGSNWGMNDVAPCRIVMGTLSPVVDYLAAKKIREAVMGVNNHNQGVLDRFLSDFGYRASDLEWIDVPAAGSVSLPREFASSPDAPTLTLVFSSGALETSSVALRIGHSQTVRFAGIFDARGRLTRSLSVPSNGNATSLFWDGLDAGGLAAAPGRYVVRVLAGRSWVAATFSLTA